MKQQALKRDDSCAGCSTELRMSDLAHWHRERRVVLCLACAVTSGEVAPSTEYPGGEEPLADADDLQESQASSVDAPNAGESSVHVVAAVTEVAVTVVEIEIEIAAAPDRPGGSAENEYEKRAARERDQKQKLIDADLLLRTERKQQRPILGAIANAFTTKPVHGPEKQATTAWKVGAAGERRVAEVLEAAVGVQGLHDRIRPGSKTANIDHIAVGPSGVFVIDAKQYKGTLEMRDKGTMFRPDPRLYVNGRDQTKLADGVLLQIEALKGVLAERWPEVPFHGVLCFVGAEWTKSKPKNVNGVVVIWPKDLTQHVSAPGQFANKVEEIAR